MTRRPYLDWLRGIAVLIMIEGHTLDSWTRTADRQSPWYQWAIVVAGYGAPIFLFLAGITLMLAAGRRLRNGLSRSDVFAAAIRRGLWVLALAFLFRLQSLVISGGRFPDSLLKVDILNVIGVSMLLGAAGLAAAATPTRKTLVFGLTTAAIAMLTPIVRSTGLLDGLPDPLEAYLRPKPGLTNFTIFPWAGFFTGGCLVGAWLDARESSKDRDTITVFAAAGMAVGAAGYAASFLPPIYRETSFWTSSPTFFFFRLGVLMLTLGTAYAFSRYWRLVPLQRFGRDSLFVYWVHVELVYGVLTGPIHRLLPFPVAVVALILFAGAMYGLVELKAAITGGRVTESVQDRAGRQRFEPKSG